MDNKMTHKKTKQDTAKTFLEMLYHEPYQKEDTLFFLATSKSSDHIQVLTRGTGGDQVQMLINFFLSSPEYVKPFQLALDIVAKRKC